MRTARGARFAPPRRLLGTEADWSEGELMTDVRDSMVPAIRLEPWPAMLAERTRSSNDAVRANPTEAR